MRPCLARSFTAIVPQPLSSGNYCPATWKRMKHGSSSALKRVQSKGSRDQRRMSCRAQRQREMAATESPTTVLSSAEVSREGVPAISISYLDSDSESSWDRYVSNHPAGT